MPSWIKSPRDGACCDCRPAVCDPCECLAGVIYYKTRSATLTKCGFDEFTSPSSPPKRYRTKSQSGSISAASGACTVPACESITNAYSGNITYASTTCGITDNRAMLLTNALTGLCGSCAGSQSFAMNADDLVSGGPDRNGNTVFEFNTGCMGAAGNIFGCGGEVVTQTAIDLSTSCSGCASGSVLVSLSNEYTTAGLISDTAAVLAGESYGSFSTTPTSFLLDLSTDELTCSIRDMIVEVRFRVPDGDCYKFKYRALFYPRDGGDPVEITSEATFTWDGVVPPGYDVDDPDTWPKFEAGAYDFALFSASLPALPSGTIVFEAYDFECTGCE